MQIENVYNGLPEEFKERVHWVPDEYRTNSLSLVPGGYLIVVEYQNGNINGYMKVKRPVNYIETFFKGAIKQGNLNYDDLNKEQQISFAKKTYRTIWKRRLRIKRDYLNGSFKKTWDSNINDSLPWFDHS